MSLRWMRRRVVARCAIAALLAGLILLAGLAVLGTQTAARAGARVAERELVSQHWSNAYVRIGVEYETLTDYLRGDEEVSRGTLASVIGSAAGDLRWLYVHGGSDARQARALHNAYDGYSYTLRNLVDSERDGTQELADARQAAESAAALRKQAADSVQRNDDEINALLAQSRRDSERLLRAVEIMSGVDLVLVLTCAVVLLMYQTSTERQASESRYRASHDGLTGIANRELLTERVKEAIEAADRDGTGVGFFLLDLNRFKEVNDTLGHHYGDLLLQEVARRLTSAVRSDSLVARLGGDEFAVLLPGVHEAADLLAIGDRVLSALHGVADLDGIAVDVSASVGAALYPHPSGSAAELLQHADVAMYAAKRGHLGISLYDRDADEHSFERLTVVGELRRAIEVGELELHYQPKVRMADGRFSGVESLVRWRHPVRGLLYPDQFIPAAEQSGLMPALTDALLAIALDQYQRWRAGGRTIPVAVNVGAACLLDAGLPGRIALLLGRYDVPAAHLTVEITESAMISDPARATTVLAELRELGVLLSIDDFGTGYSSMSYLQSMPLTELKIDRQFTTKLTSTGSGRAIIGAIVELAHALELAVVVEGVEDAETYVIARELGCEYAQGYHLSRPLPADEVAAWAPAQSSTSMAWAGHTSAA
ncbi:putative bifunctional diguanylate cyclase/phosphodiesterase [Actinoplanes sp. RD1]|uniref:putative bifunctional diguanylate cyclase/phosphodiesterase n=1 Tax=Actinoplanes sp. RD1 TaxID=3064538 RepID=UPI00274271E9|nr:bifunctional diguanylate cyclase/phosphodiesterase [Actinoplanes sp. RD1]